MSLLILPNPIRKVINNLSFCSITVSFLQLLLSVFQTLAKITVSEVAKKKHTYLDLVKTPQLRKITLCSGFFWYQISLYELLSALWI